jgi:origin recognition complex subunit 2
MSLSIVDTDQDSELYSDYDSSPSRTRARSSSRASDFTTDDDAATGTHAPSSLSTLTSFDAYFLHASRPSRTSSNVFSQLVPPLSPDEYAASLSRSFYPLPFCSRSSTLKDNDNNDDDASSAQSRQLPELEAAHRTHIPRYLLELAEGFNLLFYGLGSKRAVLNDLARACSTRAHVLVLNAFLPAFSVRDILAALARLPGAPQGVAGIAHFLSISNSNSDAEADVESRLTAAPSPPSPSRSGAAAQQQSKQHSQQQRDQSQSQSQSQPQPQPRQQRHRRRRRRLVLVVHNIDAPALRTPRARALLGALAALDGVQLAASVDHVGAPLLWTSSELLAGRWLWHDLTTLAAYDAELAGADPASLRGAGRAGAGAEGGGTQGQMMMPAMTMMTESAARHVLAAVTQRARKLFVLMGQRQLDALADAGGNSAGGRGGGVVEPTTPAEAGEVAIPYDMLFNLARDQFVATNDTALRALLGEFRDHGLVVTVGTGAMGSGEMLWIPLRKERLTKLLDGLEQGDPP